jgi:hypothetical protein
MGGTGSTGGGVAEGGGHGMGGDVAGRLSGNHSGGGGNPRSTACAVASPAGTPDKCGKKRKVVVEYPDSDDSTDSGIGIGGFLLITCAHVFTDRRMSPSDVISWQERVRTAWENIHPQIAQLFDFASSVTPASIEGSGAAFATLAFKENIDMEISKPTKEVAQLRVANLIEMVQGAFSTGYEDLDAKIVLWKAWTGSIVVLISAPEAILSRLFLNVQTSVDGLILDGGQYTVKAVNPVFLWKIEDKDASSALQNLFSSHLVDRKDEKDLLGEDVTGALLQVEPQPASSNLQHQGIFCLAEARPLKESPTEFLDLSVVHICDTTNLSGLRRPGNAHGYKIKNDAAELTLIDGIAGEPTDFPTQLILSHDDAADIIQGSVISHQSDVTALSINVNQIQLHLGIGLGTHAFRLSVWFRNNSTVFAPDPDRDEVCEVQVCHHAYVTIMQVDGEFVVTFAKEFGHGYITDVQVALVALSEVQRKVVFDVFMDAISNDGVPDQTQLRKIANLNRFGQAQYLIGSVEAHRNVREPIIYNASSKLSDGPFSSAAYQRYLQTPRKTRMRDTIIHDPRMSTSTPQGEGNSPATSITRTASGGGGGGDAEPQVPQPPPQVRDNAVAP